MSEGRGRGTRGAAVALGIVTTVAALVFVAGLALYWSPAAGIPSVLRDRPVQGLTEATGEARGSAGPLLVGGGAVGVVGAVALVLMARRDRGGRGTVWEDET